MSVKVNVKGEELEYKEGCLVKHKINDWYGILVTTDEVEGTYNVLRIDEKAKDWAFLYYTNNNVNLLGIQMYFEVVADRKDYDLTLTVK